MVSAQGEQTFFAATAKGTEDVLAGELTALGMAGVTIEKGGVRFSGDMTACYRANLWLRTASRVFMPIAEFACSTPEELYDGVRSIPWQLFLHPDMTLVVDCSLRDSFSGHSGWVALKTKDAIVDTIRDHFGRRPSVDTRDPDLRINVHLVRNRCTVSLDSSGVSLDKRGYRLDTSEAPLRETLAAALVEISGWDGATPLVDPMCGAGTILIEAALRAAGRAPGLLRTSFGFTRWPGFESAAWQALLAEANERVKVELPVPLHGFDISGKALDNARSNSKRAGVSGLVHVTRGDMRELTLQTAPGVLIFNPPYGERLGDVDSLRVLYREIGDALKRHWQGFTAYLLIGNMELVKAVGLKAARKIVLFNGPIECRFVKYELY